MKNAFQRIFSAICAASLLALTFAVLPGCSRQAVITQNLDRLSLVAMWNSVAETIDVQEDSAELGSFRLHADINGKVDSLSFDFQGRNSAGRPELYFVSMNQKGEMKWESYPSEMVQVTRHPERVFSEIDQTGLSTLESGEAGLLLQVNFQSGGVGYDYDHSDMFHLVDGNLKQLEHLVFHSSSPWCTISVARLFPTGEGGASTIAGPERIAPGERAMQIWFLSEDINKADTVTYLT